MGKLERVFVAIFCGGCLVVPAALMASGALEPEEVHVIGDGTVTYTRGGVSGLPVKSYGRRVELPVLTRNAGKAPREAAADDIPTTVVEGQVHTDTTEIPVRSRVGRGVRPEAPPEQ